MYMFICIQMLADTQQITHVHLRTKTCKEQPLSSYTHLYTYQYASTCMHTQGHTNKSSTHLHALPLLARFPFICQHRFMLASFGLFLCPLLTLMLYINFNIDFVRFLVRLGPNLAPTWLSKSTKIRSKFDIKSISFLTSISETFLIRLDLC